MLDRIDEWAAGNPSEGDTGIMERYEPTRLPAKPSLDVDLSRGGIRTVVWATGFRPDYSWIKAPVLDRKGMIRHDGGVGAVPGLYVLGLPFLRRRKSSFIHGAEDDARDLDGHIAAYVGVQADGGERASRTRRVGSPPAARA
jgi:putative flavoprotein involved in K+ transport